MRPIMNVNLKLLQVFLLVAEHSSFRSAAAAANRSQSAVSAQVKHLEEQLGVALFHRTTRSVRLTSEGEQLLDCVRRALHEVDAGLRKIAESVDLRRGHVSLGCSPTIAGARLPYVLTEFSRDYPDVTLFVRELTSSDLYQSIRQREVDFGVGPVCDDPDLTCQVILEEDLFALVPRTLFHAVNSSIELHELVRMPVLLLNPATALRELIEQTVAARGLSLSTNYQFTQTQTLITAAAAGLGTAILPKIAVPEAPHPELEVLRIVEPVMTRKIAVITLRGHALSPAAGRLAKLTAQMMQRDDTKQGEPAVRLAKTAINAKN